MIRAARPEDVPSLVALIRELARYEKLEREVVVEEQSLGEHLFGAPRHAEALVAEEGGRLVAFALYFHNYSTFLGRPGIYLEDLFVLPELRRRGIGTKLLQAVARVAVERGCGRFEWSVLTWNEPAIALYRRLGAHMLDEWRTFRLTGEALQALANRNDR